MNRLLLLTVLVLILAGLITPLSYTTSSPRGIDEYRYMDYSFWASILGNTTMLNHVLNNVVPSNGSSHSDLAEYWFWNHVIPEKWGYGYYEKLLYTKLIPSNASSGYYYMKYFKNVIAWGFEAYYMGFTNVTPIIERRVVTYYIDVLFGHLIPRNISGGFYYETVFYKLYYYNIWDYQRLLANIAYDTPYGSYIGQILTRIDFMKYMDKINSEVSSLNTSQSSSDNSNLTGTLRIKLMSIDGPVNGASVRIERLSICSGPSLYCYGGIAGYGVTDWNGVAEFRLLAGTYRVKLIYRAYGVIENVTISPGETRNITLMLGKVSFQLIDAEGYEMTGLSVSIYKQVNTLSGPRPKYQLGSVILDTNGSYTGYYIQDTYMLKPLVYNLGEPYITGIEAVAGASKTYVFHVDAVRLRVIARTPVPVDMHGVHMSVNVIAGNTYLASLEVRDGVAEAWVSPGQYYLSVENYAFKGLSFNEPGITGPVAVTIGGSNTFYVDLGVIWWKPGNVNTSSEMTYKALRVVEADGQIVKTDSIGEIDLSWGEAAILPPGTYVFTPVLGCSGNYSFKVYVSPTTSYEYTDSLPVGYLNITAVYGTSEVYMKYRVYDNICGSDEDYTSTSRGLVAVLPGTYTISPDSIGYGGTIGNISIAPGLVYTHVYRVGKLVVDVESYNGTYSTTWIPVLVFPYINGSILWDFLVTYTYTAGIAVFNLLPATYAVVVPGHNYSYAWFPQVGYGETILSLNVSDAEQVNTTIGLGRIIINITLPGQPSIVPTYLTGVLSTPEYVNNTPVPGAPINIRTIYHAPSTTVMEATPGVYSYYLADMDLQPYNDTLISNIAVEPGSLTVINYTLSLVRVHVLLNNTPIPGLTLLLYRALKGGTSYLSSTRTGIDGTAVYALPPGEYILMGYIGLSYSFVYIGNITVNGFGEVIDAAFQYPGSFLVGRIMGPGGSPASGARVYVSPQDSPWYYRTYMTSDDGYFYAYLPAGDYVVSVYPLTPYSSRGEIVELLPGEIKHITLHYSLVNLHFNVTGEPYFSMILVNNTSGNQFYFDPEIWRGKDTSLYLPPGNYTIVLPGTRTIARGWYGYGEQVSFTLTDNNTVLNYTFNLTVISIYLQGCGFDEMENSLHAFLVGYDPSLPNPYTGVIDSTYISPGNPPYTSFIATPGEYTIIIPGDPWNRTWFENTLGYYVYGDTIGYGRIFHVVAEPGTTFNEVVNVSIIAFHLDGSLPSEAQAEFYLYTTTGSIVEHYYVAPGEYHYVAVTNGTYVIWNYGEKNLSIEECMISLVELNVSGVRIETIGPEGEAVQGAFFEIKDESGSTVKTGYTDENGEYLAVLPPGEYTIVFPGLLYDYNPYNAGYYYYRQFGNGLAVPINVTGGVINETIVFSRIDVNISSPNGPVNRAQVAMYSSDMDSIIRGSLSDENGIARFYVSPGTYLLVVRGLNYGFYDYYYAGFGYYAVNGYGAIIGNVSIGFNRSITIEYNMSVIYVNMTYGDGEYVGGVNVAAYNRDGSILLNSKRSTGNGPVTFYFTNGTYTLRILSSTKAITLGEYDVAVIHYNMSKLTIRLKTPLNGYGISPSDIGVIVYYNATTTTGYSLVKYTDSNGTAVFPVFRGINVTVEVIRGHEWVKTLCISSDTLLEFNMSIFIVNVHSPLGPLRYTSFYLYTPDYSSLVYLSTDSSGRAAAVVVPGTYVLGKDYYSIIEGSLRMNVLIPEYSIVTRQLNISILRVHVQIPSLFYLGNPFIFNLESGNGSYYGYAHYIYGNNSASIYIIPDTYHVHSDALNGWDLNRTVSVQPLEIRDVYVKLGGIAVRIYKPDGTPFNYEEDHPSHRPIYIELYTQYGGTLYRYVSSSRSGPDGYAVFGPLVNGSYAISINPYHTTYGWDQDVSNISVQPLTFTPVNYTIGGLRIRLVYNNGSGVPGKLVTIRLQYGSSAAYPVYSFYTDDNGYVSTVLMPGTYAADIEGLGTVYNIVVQPGGYTNKTYTINPADLEIYNITWTPRTPSDGDTVLLTAHIRNNGPGHVFEDIKIVFYLNDTLVYTGYIHGLLAGYTANITAPITVYAGPNAVKVIVDPDESIVDDNRDNNQLDAVINALEPDIVVETAWVNGTLVDGGHVVIYANITNKGPGAIHHPFDIKIEYASKTVWRRIYVLEVGERVTVTAEIELVGGTYEAVVTADPWNTVKETNESNNKFTLTITVPIPDIYVANITLNADQLIDGGFAGINATIGNNAGSTLRDVRISLYIDDQFLGSTIIKGLGSGEVANVFFYVLLRGGSHVYRIIADPYHMVPDTNRTNNYANLTVSIPMPDLAVTSTSYWPITPSSGGIIHVKVNISNIGSGGTLTNFAVDLEVNNQVVASSYVSNNLYPGDTVTIILSARIYAGNNTVTISVDPKGYVADSNRSNNRYSFNVFIPYSDLEATALYIRPGPYHDLMTLNVTVTVRNNGPGSLNKTFYVSVFGNNEFRAQHAINGLPAGAEENITMAVTLETGAYNITVIVDDHYQRLIGGTYVYGHHHDVADPDRSNNAVSRTLSVLGPDLEVTSLQVSPSSPDPWSSFNATITVQNHGDYDSVIPVALITAIGDKTFMDEVPALPPGASVNITVRLFGIDPGTYTLRVSVNPFHEVHEYSYSDNNMSTRVIIPAPDLAITHVYGPALNGSVGAGDEIRVNITVKNLGAGFHRDVHIEAVVAGLLVGNDYILGGLGSGEEVNVTLSLTALPPSMKNTIIIIDPEKEIYDSNRTNNEAKYEGPLVDSLILAVQNYDVLIQYSEVFELKIQDNGGTSLEIVNMSFGEAGLTPLAPLPLIIHPGERIDIPVKVDTAMYGETGLAAGIVVETNSSTVINGTIYVRIHSITDTFNPGLDKYNATYSIGQDTSLSLYTGRGIEGIYDRVMVKIQGNASSMVEGTLSFNASTNTYTRIPLHVNVPAGTYILLVNVTPIGIGYSIVLRATIRVVAKPLVTIISPRNTDSLLASNTLVLSWTSNVPINGTIYFKEASESSWTVINYGIYSKKTGYRIQIGGLRNGHQYVFYLTADSGYGVYTSPLYKVNVTVSAVFHDHVLNITVERDYNQIIYVKIDNLDPYYSHSVFAKIISSDPDIIVDFIGPGSTDAVLSIDPMTTRNVMLAVHAADATRNNYTLTAMLVNLDTNATDYMVINLHVREPIFNIKLEYLGMDEHTLVQSWRLINLGDTITDLRVELEGPASTFSYIFPSMNHVRLEHGKALYFYVIPVLGLYPEDPSMHNGTILVSTGDPASYRYEIPPIKVPSGRKIYSVPVESVRGVGKAKDWYCTNRPHVDTTIKLSTDPPMINNTYNINATLWITFLPQYSHWDVKPHSGTIYVNGIAVYHWENTIPEGTIAVNLPSQVFQAAMPSGPSITTLDITVDTQHMNGGHYVVATDYTVTYETGSTSMFVAGTDYQDAKHYVDHMSKPNNDQVKPKECDKKVKMPSWLQALADALKGSKSFKFDDIPAPKILLDMLKSGSPISVDVSAEVKVSFMLKKVEIEGEGKVELGVGIYGGEGSIKVQGSWSVKNCKWGFDGITVEASAQGGYKWSYEFPLEWVKWLPREDDKKPLSVEGKIYIGLASTVFELDQHFKIKGVPTLVLGITASGEATLSIGSRMKMKATAEISFQAGYKNYDYYAQFKAGISGDVEVDLSLFSVSASGSYGLKYVYENGHWAKKSFDDPGVVFLRYKYSDEPLGYPAIIDASTSSNLGESLIAVPGLGIYTVWVSSIGNESNIMISRFNGEEWSTPVKVAFPEGMNYALTRAISVDGKLGVLALAVPDIAGNESLNEITYKLNHGTLYYMEYNGTWSTPEIVAVNVSLSLDTATYGDEALAAWSTIVNGSYRVEAMIYRNGAWGPAAIVGGSALPRSYTIYDVSAGFAHGKPVVYWAVDLYWNGETLIRGIRYSMFINDTWTAPAALPISTKASLIDSDNRGVLAWSTEDGNLYVAIMDAEWRIKWIGTGYSPTLASGSNEIVLVANDQQDTDDLDLYDIDPATLSTVHIRITNDTYTDEDPSLATTLDGRILIVWRRSLSDNVVYPGENMTWASGIVYTLVYNVTLSALYTSTPVVEGNDITIYTNITSNATETAAGKLYLYANDTVIAERPVIIPPSTTITVKVNTTLDDAGPYRIQAVLRELNITSIGSLNKSITVYSERLLENTTLTPWEYVNTTTFIHIYLNGVKKTNVTASINGSVIGKVNDTIGDVAVTLNMSGIPEGPVTINITAVTIDNTATDTMLIPVYLDKEPPIIKIYSPMNNTIVRGNISIKAEIYDHLYSLASTPTLSINGIGVEWTLVEGDNYTYVLDTSIHPDGEPINISIAATDKSRKETIVLLIVYPDNTPPTTMVNSTREWYNTSITLSLIATDNYSGVNATYYSLDGGTWTIGNTVYIPAPTDHSNDGLHSLLYYSVDNVGNTEPIHNVSIGIDTVAPTITVNHGNNTYYSGGTVNYVFQVSDELSGLREIWAYLDGSLQRHLSPGGTHQETIDFLGLNLGYMAEGMHWFKIVADDAAGNRRTYIIVFYVDKTPPTAEITYPADGAVVGGLVNITFNYTDNLSPAYAYLHIGGETINVTGTYSYLLNTSMYDDGPLTITIEAVDYSGRTTTASITIIIDNTAPVVGITQPVNGSTVSGTVEIVFSIDEEHLDQAWLVIDGEMINVTGSNSYVLDTTAFSDGPLTITLFANDTLGHGASASITIIVDNTPPTAIILSPAPGIIASGTINVTFNYSDAHLSKAILYVDNGYIDVTGEYWVLVNTGYLPDGEHNLTLYVEDEAGNTATYTIMIYTDNTPPTASITSPRDGAIISNIVNITFTYSDLFLDRAELIIGNTTIDVTGSSSYIFNTTSLPDGIYTITLRVTDKAGHETVDNVTVVIDNTAPSVAITSPANGSYVKGTISITFQYNDITLKEALLLINNVTINVTGSISYTLNTKGLPDGPCNITLLARDKAGHTGTATITIIVDNTPPTAVIESPSNGSVVSGFVEVSVSYSDANIGKVELYIDDTLIGEITGTTITIDTASYTDGQHTLKLVVEDKAGNKAEDTVLVTIDNTPPEAEILAPRNGSYVRGTVSINVSYSDLTLDKAVIIINGVEHGITGSTIYTLDTTTLPDGDLTITLRVSDKAGHLTEKTITIIIDNTPPTISITSPANNTYVSGTVTVSFTVEDANLEHAYLVIDGVKHDVTGMDSYTLDTSSLGDGEHTLTIWAVDKAGNIAESSVTIRVDNTAPVITITNPLSGEEYRVGDTVNIQWKVSDQLPVSLILVVSGEEINVTGKTSYSLSLKDVQPGILVIKIRATDAAGNTAYDTVSIIVNARTTTTTPTTTPPPTTTTPRTTRPPTTTPPVRTQPEEIGTSMIIIGIIIVLLLIAGIYLLRGKKTS